MRESSHLTSVAPPSGTHLSLARPTEVAVVRPQEIPAGLPRELPVVRPKEAAIGRPRDDAAAAQAVPKSPYAQTERTLLYVTRTPDETLTAHLRSRGWNVVAARSAHEASRLIKQDVVCAGIVDLASFAPRDLGGLGRPLRRAAGDQPPAGLR